MSRRRYYGRRNNILGLTRTEKEIFEGVLQIIRIIAIIIIGLIKGILEMIKIIINLSKNYHIAYKNGYDLNILLDKLDKLTPRQFEVLIAELFKCQGYSDVQLTQFSHDYGRDIILKRKVNGLTETVYVECKYYAPNNTIGRDICFKLLGSMQMFRADKGIVCSTGKFHKNSIEVANSVNNLELMDKTDIESMIFKLNAEQIQRIMFKLSNVS